MCLRWFVVDLYWFVVVCLRWFVVDLYWFVVVCLRWFVVDLFMVSDENAIPTIFDFPSHLKKILPERKPPVVNIKVKMKNLLQLKL